MTVPAGTSLTIIMSSPCGAVAIIGARLVVPITMGLGDTTGRHHADIEG